MNEVTDLFLERNVYPRRDEQERVQKKTFTKWINSYLIQKTPPKLVKDLMTDLKDGFLLLDLLEMLNKIVLPREKPKIMQRIHCLTNVNTAIAFMQNERKIKMVNINAADIVDGKSSIILGLIWTAILHFQIEEQEDVLLQALGMDANANVKGQAKKGLLAWTNKTLSDKYGLNISNFTEDWRDGIAFNALVHNIDSSLIDMDKLASQTNKERLENAFNIAEQELGIPKLLDVEDVDVDRPDERSIMTYVAEFLKSYPDGRRNMDDLRSQMNRVEMAPPPPTDLDLLKEFNESVDECCRNPEKKDNFDVFDGLMSIKSEMQDKLDNLLNGSDPNIDKDELDNVCEEFRKSDMKLNEWLWNLDQNLPGKLGSEFGVWLQNAEKCIMEPLPDCEEDDFDEKIIDKLEKHKKIFDKKNEILKQFKDTIKYLPVNISLKHLEHMQKRMEDVIEKEDKKREQLNILAMQAKLKDSSKQWKKDLESWNNPITSISDLNNKLSQLKASTDNGNAVEQYANELSELIKRKTKFCQENPLFDENIVGYLNQSINECEEENDDLPERFEATRGKLENLSSALNEIDDAEKRIEEFFKEMNDVLKSDDLEKQKLISQQLPEMSDLLEDIRMKVKENVAPFCSADFIKSMEQKVSNFDNKLQSLGEKVVDRIEFQEQEIAKEQQAAKESFIQNIISTNESDINDITDWVNAFEKCIQSPINGSTENIQNILDRLEELKISAPEIQNQINQGFKNVIELRNQGEPEKAKRFKDILDKLQEKFLSVKEKEIPQSFKNLKTMKDTISNVENGIVDLDKLNNEGENIKKNLENSKNTNDAMNNINKEKEFLAKEKDIIDSITKNKELLKKLKEISKNSNLIIDLEPLEKKLAASESSLKELLRNAEEKILATNTCESACKDATKYLDEISKKVNNDQKFPNDEDSQKAKLQNIENIEKELLKAEDLIKATVNQINSAQPHLTKAQRDELDQKVSKMKQNAADLRNHLKNTKEDLKDHLNEWNSFNNTKNIVSGEFEKLAKGIETSNKEQHGANLQDKAAMLKENKKLLSGLKSKEKEIDDLIEKAKKLGSEKPLAEVLNMKKEFLKKKENLEQIVQQNEDDLEKHENYKRTLDKFNDESNSIIKSINEQIAKSPNTKEGLKNKLKLYDDLNEIYNQRKKLLVDLEGMKNDVVNHSSPRADKELEEQWDKIVDGFEKNFNPSSDNQAKLLKAVQQIEETEAACSDYAQKLADIENREKIIMNKPTFSIEDVESKLQSLKDLRFELKELQTPINEMTKKRPNEIAENLIKPKFNTLTNQYKAINETMGSNLAECENQHRELSNIYSNMNNFKTWLEATKEQIEDRSAITNLELNSLKKGLNSLKSLRDDIAEHKVDLSRLQTSIDSVMKISKENTLQNSLDDLTDSYQELFTRCQDEAERSDILIKLMNKYENSRANALHWIDTNTQVLLKCSDYTLNQSQIKSKMLMIENLEKDLENNGQTKFIEAIQDGEELMSELSGTSRQLIAEQNADLKSDWTELSRQLNQLSSSLKSTIARSDAFKEMSGKLNDWLDDMEHTAMMDASSIEHSCEIPHENSSNRKCDRIKTLLVELERRQPEFTQLSHMTSDLANPSFDIENSQIQNRFNRLQTNIKDKIEKLSKHQADYDKIKQNLEEMEKWIFQASMKIINENAQQGRLDNNRIIEDLIRHSNEIIQSIESKEPEILNIRQSIAEITNDADNDFPEIEKELKIDLEKLEENYNNLKDTATHKRDHLMGSMKQWNNYQNLLQTTKTFLENDMPRWWNAKSQVASKTVYSSKDAEKEFKDISEMENKLNAFKNNLENAAKQCDGIHPTITSALSKSQTPNNKNVWFNDQTDSFPKTFSESNLLAKPVFDDLEKNLKKLSELRKEREEETANWNNFNREKTSLKNWLDNEKMKLASTLKSAPGMTNMDAFQKDKLKTIQDEINYKKPLLKHLNSRFAELTSKMSLAADPILKAINKEFEDTEKQLAKLLNREDKEVEANFDEDDLKLDIVEEIKVPKLNLSSLDTQTYNNYESPNNLTRFTQTFKPKETKLTKPKSSNFGGQTPGTKRTQTHFKESLNLGTQTFPTNKDRKTDSIHKILDSLKHINNHLEHSKAPSDYSPNILLSERSRSVNQESVRRNMVPSNIYPTIKPPISGRFERTPRPLLSRSQSIRPISQTPTPKSNLILDHLDFYIPTKDKWHTLDSAPYSSRDPLYNSQIDIPNREFQIDYNSPYEKSRDSSRSNYLRNSSGNSKKFRNKNSGIKESINRINQDANDLRKLSEKLRNY